MWKAGSRRYVIHSWLWNGNFSTVVFVALTNALLLSCTKICHLSFSRCAEWWSMESLILYLLSSGTSLGTSGSRNWPVISPAWKLETSLYQFYSWHPRCLKFSTHLRIKGRLAGFLVYCLKIPPNRYYGRRFNLSSSTVKYLLNGKIENIHIFVLTYDEEMRSLFWYRPNVESFDDLNQYFSSSIHEDYLEVHSRAIFECNL